MTTLYRDGANTIHGYNFKIIQRVCGVVELKLTLLNVPWWCTALLGVVSSRSHGREKVLELCPLGDGHIQRGKVFFSIGILKVSGTLQVLDGGGGSGERERASGFGKACHAGICKYTL